MLLSGPGFCVLSPKSSADVIASRTFATFARDYARAFS